MTNPYFEQTVLNADPIELTRMVYQRAVFSVRDAREHLHHKRIAKRSLAIMRAYSAIAELLSALRHEIAPELAARLQNLYFYMQQRLLDANAQQADQPLAEVLSLLTTLEEAWSGAAAQLKEAAQPPKEAPQLKPHEAARGGLEAHKLEADERWRIPGSASEASVRVAMNA